MHGNVIGENSGLNPFMNQVYFYYPELQDALRAVKGLNPFMNQVYFYYGYAKIRKRSIDFVLIPL